MNGSLLLEIILVFVEMVITKQLLTVIWSTYYLLDLSPWPSATFLS